MIYLGTKPEPATKALHKEYVAYDEMIKKATLPDLQTGLFFFVGNEFLVERRYYANDGLHLSELGYTIWNDKIDKLLENILHPSK